MCFFQKKYCSKQIDLSQKRTPYNVEKFIWFATIKEVRSTIGNPIFLSIKSIERKSR